jgi:CheY-like chemotaxis protein
MAIFENLLYAAGHMKNAGDKAGTARAFHALIVEDDMLIMLDMEEILISMGIPKVSCATSIEGALKILGTEKPDFALMDFHLGKSTSRELATKLQALNIPFAFVTALVTPQAISPDFVDVSLITKPFSEVDIRRAVEQMLRNSQR